MSKLSKFLAASLAIFSTSVSADFSGIWRIEFPKNGTITNVADKFDVYLTQEKNTICGFHYGTGRGTAKIDWGWADDEKPTVYGQAISSNTAKVTLHSSHSDKPIEALLSIKEGQLIWSSNISEIELPPTIPKSATLTKITPKGHEFRGLKSCSAKGT
ncbi:hypothetical protein [Pseudomonas sp. NPDC079086]|uniref:hypothetical protein n=1 Tax=unclassified Pseudomonas TaxID=196821 RepID=UPI0037C6F64E